MILRNEELKFEVLYTQLEKAKSKYTGNLIGIINFCQSCLSDDKLVFLPNEIEIIESKVIFNYEEDTIDHLVVTFPYEPSSENSKVVDYFYFRDDHIVAESGKSWLEVRKIINDFGKNTLLKDA